MGKKEAIEPEVVKKVKKGPKGGKQPGVLATKTRKAVSLVVNHGVDPKDAYALVNGKPPKRDALDNLREQVRKYSLQTPQMQRLARDAVKDALQGKEMRYDAVKILGNGAKVPYEEVIVPSYTNKLAAAAMVQDRVDPVVRRSENINVNVDCCPVDLSRYRR